MTETKRCAVCGVAMVVVGQVPRRKPAPKARLRVRSTPWKHRTWNWRRRQTASPPILVTHPELERVRNQYKGSHGPRGRRRPGGEVAGWEPVWRCPRESEHAAPERGDYFRARREGRLHQRERGNEA